MLWNSEMENSKYHGKAKAGLSHHNAGITASQRITERPPQCHQIRPSAFGKGCTPLTQTCSLILLSEFQQISETNVMVSLVRWHWGKPSCNPPQFPPSLQLQSSAEAKNICLWPAAHTMYPAHSQPGKQARCRDNSSPFFILKLWESLNWCNNYYFFSFKKEDRKRYTNLALSGSCGLPAMLNSDPSEQLFSLSLNHFTPKLSILRGKQNYVQNH